VDSLDNKELSSIFKAKLSDKDFERLSKFIYTKYGIKMPKVKKIMLQSRLQKRLRELKINNYKDYCDYVFSNEGNDNEVIHMIDVVSTNKTDFFREPTHFDFLHQSILPQIFKDNNFNKELKLWSAGCSSGEEPYTIAISLSEFLKKSKTLFDFSILATDISTRILNDAVSAVYKEEKIKHLPIEYKKKYFLKSKDRSIQKVRLNSSIREKVNFRRLNFMDNSYDIRDYFDIVFCRNVLIYFDRETQEKVINRICTKIRSGGYFFLGHSESIMKMDVPLTQIKPTVFRKV